MAQHLEDTGERLIPDRVDRRDMLALYLLDQHLARYQAVCSAVEDQRVLDLACGSGFGAHRLATSGAGAVLGIDRAAAAVAYARTRYRAPNLSFEQGAADQFALGPARFDVITCLETLEHVEAPAAFLQALIGGLAPGGLLFLSATTVETRLLYRYHLHDFRPEDLKAMARAADLRVEHELVQAFVASPAEVRCSMRLHPQAPPLARGLAQPGRMIQALVRACVTQGLRYENRMLRLSKPV